MSNPSRLIAIGELARRTGLASSALRYYERAGLLSPTARAGGTTALRVLDASSAWPWSNSAKTPGSPFARSLRS